MPEKPVTGSVTFKQGARYYSLHFPSHGWMAADLVQYVDDVLRADNREIAILKLLGYTLEMGDRSPSRKADHWVEVDLENRVVATNSELIRKAVDQAPRKEEEPYSPAALRRLYEVLDEFDFTVELF